MIRIGICDGVTEDCDRLETIIKSNREGRVVLIKKFHNLKGLKWAVEDEEEFDALFIWIGTGSEAEDRMDELINGVIKSRMPSARIVLMSDSITDCIKTLELGAFEFIYKPFDEKMVKKVCSKILNSCRKDDIIAVHKRGMVINVRLDDIVYIRRNGRKIFIRRRNADDISVYDNIDEIERKIVEVNPAFCRIHSSYIVNLGKIRIYRRDRVQMDNGDSLIISRKYVEIARKRYVDEYLKKRVNVGKRHSRE